MADNTESSNRGPMSAIPPTKTTVAEQAKTTLPEKVATPPQQYNTYKNWAAHDPQTFIQDEHIERDANRPCHDHLLAREVTNTRYVQPSRYPGPTEYQPNHLVPRSLMDKHMITKGWQSDEPTERMEATNPSKLDVVECHLPLDDTKPVLPYHASINHCQHDCESKEECFGFSHDGTHCTLLGNGVLTKNPGFIAGRSSDNTNTYIKSSQGKVCEGVHLKDRWDLRDCAAEKARLQHVAKPLAPMKPFFNML